LPNPGLTSTFTDSRGIVWRVIAAEGNSRLIMTEYVHRRDVQYNLTNVYTRLSLSNLRDVLNDWGAENLAPELAARARIPNNVDNDLRAVPGPDWNIAENEPAGWTLPGPGVVAVNAAEALFVLSFSELNRYASAIGSTNAQRQARTPGGVNFAWWLRSPGTAENATLSLVTSGGGKSISTANPFGNLGVRPALWINL